MRRKGATNLLLLYLLGDEYREPVELLRDLRLGLQIPLAISELQGATSLLRAGGERIGAEGSLKKLWLGLESTRAE